MVDSRSTTGLGPRRRLAAGILGTALVGALLAPAAVLAVGPMPVDDLITTTEDHATVTGNVLLNDTDAGIVRSAGYHISDATPGTLTVATNGDYAFRPAAGWTGTRILIGYYWADADENPGGELLTNIRVTVTAVNHAPSFTKGADQVAAEDAGAQTVNGWASGISAGSGETQVVTFHATTDNDALFSAGPAIAANGTLSYTPAANASGSAVVTVWLTDDGGTADGGVDRSADQTVTITVTAVNDAPTATPQDVIVVFNTARAITLAGTDLESAAGSLTVASRTDPTHGDLTGTGANLVYTPDADYTGLDSFTFKMHDGIADSESATVDIIVADDAVAPTVPAPTVAFGAGRVNESAPITIAWTATDAGVGVASYVVEGKVGSGAWTQVYAGSDTSITKSYAFGVSLQWRVKAIDNNDNESAFTTSAVRTITAYQGGSPIAVTGTWKTVASSSSSGTGFRYTTTSGKYAKLAFSNAIGVLYVAPKTSAGGYVKVKIDGTTYARTNLRASTSAYGVIIRSKAWSTPGLHTIWVFNDQGGRRANVDAFVVLR